MAVALDASAQDKPDWDEAQCKAALARLEQLQDLIDSLRTVIPRLIKPLLEPQLSPTDLFQDFKCAAAEAAKELRTFRAEWGAEDTQKILQEAKKSFEANWDLRPADDVPRYGWSEDTLQGQNEVTAAYDGEGYDNDGNDENERNIGDMGPWLEEFQAGHTDWLVEFDAEDQAVVMQAPASHRRLRFMLKLKKDGPREYLEVECTGNSKFARAVTRSIASRPRPYDLRYLLDMLASYKLDNDTKCSACGNMIDRNGLTPAARRSKRAKGTNGSPAIIWEPYHEGCL